ncbi:hypothetical protein OB2597_18312 [Pseudooceanicola batsensis HTCC2597]|uniref:Uncharacterized protein n=1 Tax=Pseudooceanicola batsensis (strain ATCC BAA-863 / DSM 15984 / KCTC 12145 / HTCC2597) TaxID=252305 RepID=A3U066_PSEBH|nr:hypothetical protein [Pseudooceanicola batsensis]EAQ02697.1 hypothetical protein OB2597_18312 [Pseudooceanicola batsensis HTCC2597]
MKVAKSEAAPLARLIGTDPDHTLAWVYVWNTSELSILWLDRRVPPKFIDPPLPKGVLDQAMTVTSDDVTDLLKALSERASDA